MRTFLKGIATALAKITGGTIDGTPIGATTAAAGAFTTISTSSTGTFGDSVATAATLMAKGKLAANQSATTVIDYDGAGRYGRILAYSGTASAAGMQFFGGAANTNPVLLGFFDALGNFTPTAGINCPGPAVFKGAVLEPGLQIVVPAAGGSTTIAQTTSALVLNATATIASHTVVFPTPLGDGHIFEALTTNTITTLTCTGSSGSTVKNAPTTLAAGTGFEFIYSATATTWFRKR